MAHSTRATGLHICVIALKIQSVLLCVLSKTTAKLLDENAYPVLGSLKINRLITLIFLHFNTIKFLEKVYVFSRNRLHIIYIILAELPKITLYLPITF